MDFEILKDLVTSITRNKVKNIEILGNEDSPDSIVGHFYDAISKSLINDDKDAANLLFSTVDTHDVRYLRVKGRLFNQLVNTSLFVDVNTPQYNERQKAYYNCYKNFAAAHILALRNAPKASIYLYEITLNQAIKYEFTELAYLICRELRIRLTRNTGDRPLLNHYSNLFNKYKFIKDWENLGLSYQEDLLNIISEKPGPNPVLSNISEKYYKKLLSIKHQVNTAYFSYICWSVGFYYHLSINDYENAIKLSKEFIDAYKNSENINYGIWGALFSRTMFAISKTRSNDFNDDYHSIESQCSKIVERGTTNWFQYKLFSIVWHIKSRNYDKCLNVFSTVSFKEINQQPVYSQEIWYLYAAYLHLIAQLGQVPVADVEAAAGPFRGKKFKNDFTVFTKDKHGMNIPIIFLPVLYAIATKTDLPVSPESLHKYRQRYFEGTMNQRSAHFMNMLLAWFDLPYDRENAERKIDREWQLMCAIDPSVPGQNAIAEIIPYEHLWEMIQQKNRRPQR